MTEWDNLLDSLKDFNRQQADYIMEKLRRVGCTVHKVEIMAEMEHE